MQRFFAPIPLSLYVHIPWCARKCPYCDFNSHEISAPVPEQVYIDALLADLELDYCQVRERSIESVFIGGGTPSLFSAEAIDRLLAGLRARLRLRADIEITLEANPGTVEQRKFGEFRHAGINRLSIGVQSFNSNHLRKLGRIHGREEAILAAESAHAAGLDNFNLDLMFGLPGQSLEQALADIEMAIALNPAHISHYQLTLEPNTFFHKYPPNLPDDDQVWVMQGCCQERLAIGNYIQYEVAGYARPGRWCCHNLNYWEFGDYLGIGAGAHGKITDMTKSKIIRLWKQKKPRDYLKHAGTGTGIGGVGAVSIRDVELEFMMNALRLVEGFPSKLFEERAGLTLGCIEPALSKAERKGFLIRDNDWIRPTELGRYFLNDLLELFLPDADDH